MNEQTVVVLDVAIAAEIQNGAFSALVKTVYEIYESSGVDDLWMEKGLT